MKPRARNNRKIDSRLFFEQYLRVTHRALTSANNGSGVEKYWLNNANDTIKRLYLSALL